MWCLAALVTGCDADHDGLRFEGQHQTDPQNPDTDGDRVLDGDEIARALDPLSPDSDGDGYLDGDELLEGSDPLDPTSWIYTGGWPYRYDGDETIVDPGFSEPNVTGATIPRLRGVDQHGDEVDLYDFAFQGKPVIIDICSMWRVDCRSLAGFRQVEPDTSGPWEDLDPLRRPLARGEFTWVTVLLESEEGVQATAADASEWAETYPQPLVPVLYADHAQALFDWATQGRSVLLTPTFIWLDEGMVVRRLDSEDDPWVGSYTIFVFASSFR